MFSRYLFASRALRYYRGKLGRSLHSPDQEEILVFTHVPKTGGTSLTSVLREIYGPRMLNVGRERRAVEFSGIKDPELLLAISGHFHYGWIETLLDSGGCPIFEGRKSRYVALVREPVSRVISYFRYATSYPKHRLYDQVQGMSAEVFFEFLDRKGIQECWNQQHRMIGDHLDDYFLAAPLEEIEAFNRTLVTSFGWRREVPIPHANRQKRPDSAPVGTEILDLIRQRSGLDTKVYEAVTDRFRAKKFPAQRNLES